MMMISQKQFVTLVKTFFTVTLLCLLGSNQAFAQAKFYASAPKSVPVNANFQLGLTIENGNGTKTQEKQLFLGGSRLPVLVYEAAGTYGNQHEIKGHGTSVEAYPTVYGR